MIRAALLPLLCAGVVLAATACSSEADHPFGGPFGDSTDPPATSDTSGDDTSATGGGDAGAKGTDSGAAKGGSGTGGTGVSGGGSGSGSGAGSGSGSGSGSGGTGGAGAPTWTQIYGTYFGPGTAGRCGDSGCHQSTKSGFKCGTDKNTCFQGFSSGGWVSGGASAAIVDPSTSCLAWFGGNMPPRASANQKLVDDLKAWAKDGAQNN